MKNKFVFSFSLFIILVYIFATAFLTVNLILEYNNSKIANGKTFNFVSNKIISSVQDESINPQQEFVSLVEKESSIMYLEIKENDSLIFKYPANFDINNNNSMMVSSFSSTKEVLNSVITINCSLYKIKPISIFNYAKISFIIILFAIILTIILLIYIYNNKKKSDEVLAETDLDTSINKIETDNLNDISSDEAVDLSDLDNEKNDIQPLDLVAEKTSEDDLTVTNITNEDTITEDDEPLVQDKDVDSTQEINPDDSPATENKEPKIVSLPIEDSLPVEISQDELNTSTPEGLFSPKTGLGWQSYLLTRLNSELNRAISSEFDLALFMIRIPSINHDDSRIKIIADYLANQFQFKDLIFEYKDDSFVAIKTNMSLDEALIFAEKVHDDIIELFTDEKITCFIGISTRTIRIISGERLLHETEEALNHTSEENDSFIIAFRANIEKYRQYMNS